MKTYERESFLKSFFIFFLLIEVLLALNYWYEYRAAVASLKRYIHTEMRLCAFTLECEGMETDFVKEKGKELEKNILYERDDFYAYFELPSKKFLMKVVYPRSRFEALLARKVGELKFRLAIYSVFAAAISLLFALYTLMPLRKALRLNEEFVRDILHDFNTPLSSMRINLKLFKKEIGDDPKIARLEHNIQTVMALQSNLRIFLKELPTQTERFDVFRLVRERLVYFQTLYPGVDFRFEGKSVWVETNPDAFVRIVDNVLSNAGKYNRPGGEVRVRLTEKELVIEDNGIGIAEPERAFDRYYKEQERGIGIGLHVVKKLCEETDIGISLASEKGKGTRVVLDISRLRV